MIDLFHDDWFEQESMEEIFSEHVMIVIVVAFLSHFKSAHIWSLFEMLLLYWVFLGFFFLR